MPPDSQKIASFRLNGWTVLPADGTLQSQPEGSEGETTRRLQPKAMDLLVFLADNAGEVVSKDEILEAVWGDSFVEEGALPQCVHSLRKAFGDQPREPRFIETIPRRGYRLIARLERGPLIQPPEPAIKRKARALAAAAVVTALGLVLIREAGIRVTRQESFLRHGGRSPIADANPPYLEGRELITGPYFEPEKARRAVELFKDATEKDPAFAEAFAELSKASSWLYFNGFRRYRGEATLALDRAQELGPDLRQTHLARAYYQCWVQRRYEEAIDSFLRAADGRDEDDEILLGIGYAERRLGRLDQALSRLERAFDLRLGDALLAGEIAKTHVARRDFASAEDWFRSSLAINPDQPQLIGDRALNLLALRGCGEDGFCSTVEARQLIESAEEKHRGYLSYFVFLLNLYDAAGLTGDRWEEVATAALDRLAKTPREDRNPADEYSLFWRRALLFRRLGQVDLERELAERYRAILEPKIEAGSDYSYHHIYLALAYAFLERRQEALEQAQEAVAIARDFDHYNSPRIEEFQAIVHLILNEPGPALDLLTELLETPYQYALTRARLRLDPVWDPLRGEARFRALLEP